MTSIRSASEGQGVKLVSSGRGSIFDELELPLLDPVHALDARDDGASAAKRLESGHWSQDAFDGAVILIDQINEVLRLPYLDVRAAVGAHSHHRCRVGAALADRDPLGHAVQVDSAFEDAPCRGEVFLGAKSEVDRVPDTVHPPVQAFPLAADLDISFVYSPARADWPLALVKHRCERRH